MKRIELDQKLKSLKAEYHTIPVHTERGWLSLSEKLSGVAQEARTVREIALQTPGRSFMMKYAPSMIALAVIFGGGVTGVFASQKALPGDVLYPLKRAQEAVKEKAAFSAKQKTELKLQQAEERLSEIKQLDVLHKEHQVPAPSVENENEFENTLLDAIDKFQEISVSEQNIEQKQIKDWENRLHMLRNASSEVENESNDAEVQDAIKDEDTNVQGEDNNEIQVQKREEKDENHQESEREGDSREY